MSPPIPQSFQRLPTGLRQTEILNLAYEAPQGVACAPQLQLLHSALCSALATSSFSLVYSSRQTSSHHRIFAQAIPSVCSDLFPFLCLDILQGHLFRESFPNHHYQARSHASTVNFRAIYPTLFHVVILFLSQTASFHRARTSIVLCFST